MRLPASGSREALWLVAAVFVFGTVGIVLGLNAPVQIPAGYARYTAVMILAALDSVLGAVKAWLNGNFENKVFISGMLVNSLAAGALTYLGDKLGVAPIPEKGGSGYVIGPDPAEGASANARRRMKEYLASEEPLPGD